MMSDSDRKSSPTRSDVSLAELHALISTLEEQLKAGITPAHLAIRADESAMPKALMSERDEPVILVDY